MKAKKGDVKVEHGIRFIFTGRSWSLDQTIDTIDRHHTYEGQQDPIKPYRVKGSHIVCGTRLLR
jgi:hypothetical protein